MTPKTPYPFSNNDHPVAERDIFFSADEEKIVRQKLVKYSFSFACMAFLFSWLGVFFFMKIFPVQDNEVNFFREFSLSILFFLPVLLTILLVRSAVLKRSSLPPQARKNFFLFALPQKYSTGKKAFYFFCTAFFGGLLLQCIVLLITFLQNILFQKLGFPVLPQQERVLQIIKLFENGGGIFSFFTVLFAPLFLAPLTEELFFRLVLFEKMREYMRFLPALVCTSFVFALFHGNLHSFLPLFLVGAVCQKACLKNGSLLTPVILHFSFNLSTFLLLFLMKS